MSKRSYHRATSRSPTMLSAVPSLVQAGESYREHTTVASRQASQVVPRSDVMEQIFLSSQFTMILKLENQLSSLCV